MNKRRSLCRILEVGVSPTQTVQVQFRPTPRSGHQRACGRVRREEERGDGLESRTERQLECPRSLMMSWHLGLQPIKTIPHSATSAPACALSPPPSHAAKSGRAAVAAPHVRTHTGRVLLFVSFPPAFQPHPVSRASNNRRYCIYSSS